MKLSLKSIATLSTLSALVMAPLFLGAGSASAQPAGFNGSYVGAGVAGSVTRGGRVNDDATFGGNVQGRFAVPNAPVSVRGAVLFTGNNSVIVPSLSYDLPVSKNTNIYAGAGYAFVQDGNRTSQLGNQNSAVLSAGVESEVARGVVLYSDAKYGINSYKGGADALSLQAGVGLKF